MTLRMPKIVQSSAEAIAQSMIWAAATRLGVPIILALIVTGIPAHLVWAGRVNEELGVFRRDIAAVVGEVKTLKETARDDKTAESKMQADLAAVTTNVSAILRAIDRVEKQVDLLAPRRMQ
jgi:hypothetical protein